jgi:uncharacterized membrane protein YbhN (UPF0104 family)
MIHDPDPTSAPIQKPSWPALWNLLKIILAAVLTYIVLSNTDVKQLLDVLGNASMPWLLVSLLLFTLLTLLKSIQYYVLIGAGLRYGDVLNVVILQNAISNFVTSGAGIVSMVASLRMDHGVKISRSLVMFTLTKVGDLLAIGLGLLISSMLVWRGIEALHGLVTVLLGGIGALICLVLLAVGLRGRFTSRVAQLLERAGLARLSPVKSGLSALQALAGMGQGRVLGRLAIVLVYSVLYLLLNVAWAYANFSVFRLQLDLVSVVFVNMLMQLISLIPIQVFGGLGVSEAGMLYFFGVLGISSVVLTSPLIGMRLLVYLESAVVLLYLPVRSAIRRARPQVLR